MRERERNSVWCMWVWLLRIPWLQTSIMCACFYGAFDWLYSSSISNLWCSSKQTILLCMMHLSLASTNPLIANVCACTCMCACFSMLYGTFDWHYLSSISNLWCSSKQTIIVKINNFYTYACTCTYVLQNSIHVHVHVCIHVKLTFSDGPQG